MRRMRNPNELFVGDLSYFCGEEQLYDLFGHYGGILDVRIKRSDAKGKTLMYGFVKMESLKSALLAAKELNGILYMGRLMRVQLSLTNTNYENNAQTKAGVQVHFSVTSSFPDEEVIQPHEGIVRNVFEGYGEIVDIVIKDYKAHKGEARQEGYGFITFANEDHAYAAVQACNKFVTPEGIKIECSLSHRNKANANMRQFEEQLSPYGQDPSMAGFPPHVYPPPPMDMMNRGSPNLRAYHSNNSMGENCTNSAEGSNNWNAASNSISGKEVSNSGKFSSSPLSPTSSMTSGSLYPNTDINSSSSSSHSYLDSNPSMHSGGPAAPQSAPQPSVYGSSHATPILNPNYSMYMNTISMQQQQYLQSINNSFVPSYPTPASAMISTPAYMAMAPPPPAMSPQQGYRMGGYPQQPSVGMMRYHPHDYSMMAMDASLPQQQQPQQQQSRSHAYIPHHQPYHAQQHPQHHQQQYPPHNGYHKPPYEY